ncbi:hypothetical protein BDZ97DRAFT_801232 [Flammula alnicola]|nr:hypothetical protein BDZ97DRAFT_801232 [Flammula alnicola]
MSLSPITFSLLLLCYVCRVINFLSLALLLPSRTLLRSFVLAPQSNFFSRNAPSCDFYREYSKSTLMERNISHKRIIQVGLKNVLEMLLYSKTGSTRRHVTRTANYWFIRFVSH